MTVFRNEEVPNPLEGWQVDPSNIRYIGEDLQRPECILAERDGTLWSADARGGVVRINPGGKQELITQSAEGHFDLSANASKSLLSGTLPNGLAFGRTGEIIISNFGTDRLEVMTRDGETRVIADQIDGKPLGKVNFVLRDSLDRLWITISTMINPWSDAIRPNVADGYICLLDDRGLRIVADGFHFTNELRFDAAEEWLYVAETTAKRVSRLRVQSDGSLTDREVFGPSNLGRGLIDGIAFDVYGNLWGTMIMADRLIAITPKGDLLELLADMDCGASDRFEAAFESEVPVPFDVMMAATGKIAPWMASVTFGGPDLRTAYIGSLRGNRIPYFATPVAGLPMVHWGN